MKLIKYLRGKKVYLLQAAAVIYAITGLITGNIDGKTALEIIYASGTIAAFRSALSN